MQKNDYLVDAAVPGKTVPTLLTERQLATRWQLSVRTLQANRWKQIGCPFVKVGRLVRYRLEDVLDYEAARLIS